MDKQSVSNDLLRNVASRMNKMTGKGNASVSQTRLPVMGSLNPKTDFADHEFSKSRSLTHNNPSLSSTGPLKSTQDVSYSGTDGLNDNSAPEGDRVRVSNLAGRSYTTRVSNYPTMFTDSAHDYDINVQARNTGDMDANNVHNINDVAKLFGVSLNTLKDIDDFVQDLQLGKHELWPLLSKEKGNEITDIVCNRYVFLSESASMPSGVPIVDELSTKASPNVNDNLSSKNSPSNPIAQSVDINTKSTSYAGAAGPSTMAQPQVNSNFCPLVADPVLNGVNISIARKVIKKMIRNTPIILKKWSMSTSLLKEELTRIPIWVKLHDVPLQVFEEDGISLIATFIRKTIMLDAYTSSMCKDSRETIRVEYEWRPPRCDVCKIFGHVYDHCPKKVVSPPIVTTSNVAAPTVEKSNDGFQTMGKKKKRKYKSKSTNGGQFAGPSVKQTVRYEPKETPSTPKKGTTSVSNPSTSSSMLKTTVTLPKQDNFTTSNSISALNDDEKVENVYDESKNLFQTDGSSSFTAIAG
nr:hypothetical protein [Tanacetum cinerariifolium]